MAIGYYWIFFTSNNNIWHLYSTLSSYLAALRHFAVLLSLIQTCFNSAPTSTPKPAYIYKCMLPLKLQSITQTHSQHIVLSYSIQLTWTSFLSCFQCHSFPCLLIVVFLVMKHLFLCRSLVNEIDGKRRKNPGQCLRLVQKWKLSSCW